MTSIKNLIRKSISPSKLQLYRNMRANIIGTLLPFNLTRMAKYYDTDKWGRHYYTPNYQNHFRKFKFEKIKLLEIGVGGYDSPDKGGNSLRMWKKYFPFGKIYSIDIYDKHKLQENRIRIFQGSQIDELFLQELMKEIGELDIIIDDGSHNNQHIIKTFEILFPYLKVGGIYVVEDTETSYREELKGDSQDLTNPKTTMNFFKTFPDRINKSEFNLPIFENDNYSNFIFSIHFYHNLIFIYKSINCERSSNYR